MGAGYNRITKALTVTESAPGLIPGIDATLRTKDGSHTYQMARDRVEEIEAVGAIVRHELKHKELFEMNGDDYDKDGVVDEIETAVENPWLDPFQPNTYADFNVDLFYQDLNGWLNEGGEDEKDRKANMVEEHRGQLRVVGDNELLAIIAERDREVSKEDDWAFSRAARPDGRVNRSYLDNKRNQWGSCRLDPHFSSLSGTLASVFFPPKIRNRSSVLGRGFPSAGKICPV